MRSKILDLSFLAIVLIFLGVIANDAYAVATTSTTSVFYNNGPQAHNACDAASGLDCNGGVDFPISGFNSDYHYLTIGNDEQALDARNTYCSQEGGPASICNQFLFHYSNIGICPEGTTVDPITGQCIEDAEECNIDVSEQNVFEFSGSVPTSACFESCKFILSGAYFTGYTDGVATGGQAYYTSTGNVCDGSEGGNTINDSDADTDDGCPNGFQMTSSGCQPDPPPIADADQSNNSCPNGYFADANGTCWYDPSGTEGGLKESGESTGGGAGGLSFNDTDGDGIPNESDNDIDGDGLDNSVDPDIDGDGVLNEDDSEPEGETPKGLATNCDVAPTSVGDAQLAAIHHQLWLNECGIEDVDIENALDCNLPFICKASPFECATLRIQRAEFCGGEVTSLDDCAVAIECTGDALDCALLGFKKDQACALETAASDAEAEIATIGTGDLDTLTEGQLFDELLGSNEVDLQSDLGNFFSVAPQTGTCPAAQSVNLGKWGTVEFSYQLFCDLASAIRAIILLAATMVGGTIVLRSATS